MISRSRHADRSLPMNTTWTIYESPVGPLTLVGGPRGLTRLYFPGHAGRLDEERHAPECFADAMAQLEEYFAGRRRRFELDLDLQGTPFQQSVWAQLAAIPHGETRAYGELARAIGRPDRARAVGAAIGRTPVPIIVPCHRAGRCQRPVDRLPRRLGAQAHAARPGGIGERRAAAAGRAPAVADVAAAGPRVR